MTRLPNPNIGRLAIHSTLNQLAWGFSGIFFSVFLLRAGVQPAAVFVAIAGTLVLRFALRPLVLFVAPITGPRRMLILGTLLAALKYPVLALVRGPGPELLLFCIIAAVGEIFYWTCYHAFFAALGDSERRGSQLGARQVLCAIAGIIGPAAGGAMLVKFGPGTAFGMAAAIEVAATLPLFKVTEPRFLSKASSAAYESAKVGTRLFFADGWITASSMFAWDMIAFRALDARYDAFGGMLAAAALVGALGGVLIGRWMDAGQARRIVWVNAAVAAGILVLKSLCGGHPITVVTATTVAALLSGLYIPSFMTAVYNDAKASPCPLRFHFAAEGAWDAGGSLACILAAAACIAHLPLEAIILMALPGVALQVHLLNRRYRAASAPGVPNSSARHYV